MMALRALLPARKQTIKAILNIFFSSTVNIQVPEGSCLHEEEKNYINDNNNSNNIIDDNYNNTIYVVMNDNKQKGAAYAFKFQE